MDLTPRGSCVMGHEFTHGFDNTGRKFDAHSRMREWWQKPVVSVDCCSLLVLQVDLAEQRFREHSHCIEKLYDNFEIAGENGEAPVTRGHLLMAGQSMGTGRWGRISQTWGV